MKYTRLKDLREDKDIYQKEIAKLLNISDLQMGYITNVNAGEGLIKIGSSLIPFVNKFPKNTELYKLMTTKPRRGHCIK